MGICMTRRSALIKGLRSNTKFVEQDLPSVASRPLKLEHRRTQVGIVNVAEDKKGLCSPSTKRSSG